MRWIGLACLVVISSIGCKGDPILKGRRLLDSDPARAAALFREAASLKSPCFECEAWLGAALERTKDLPGAAQAYERAWILPESSSRPEPVGARLLNVYETMFRDTTDAATRTDIARKAAPIEASLGLAKPWANPFLGEIARKEIAAIAETGKSRETRAAIDAAMSLYLSADSKKQLAGEATEALRKAFVISNSSKFMKELAAPLERDGLFDPNTSDVVISNHFTIPTKKADPRFDPASADFSTAVKTQSCLPLRTTLEKLVGRCAPALGIRKATPADLDWIFAQIFRDARAGFATYGSAERSPTGESWLCEVRMPLPRFLGELYRFAE
jgi:hypothetical protein